MRGKITYQLQIHEVGSIMVLTKQVEYPPPFNSIATPVNTQLFRFLSHVICWDSFLVIN